MKSPDFEYARPGTLEEAIALLSDDNSDALPLAGGQSLMAMMNLRVAGPDRLVDLSDLTDLSGIEESGDIIRIGAMTRHVELEESSLVAKHLPLIATAIKEVAHVAIRNRGTIGGSLALADPAAELPACCVAYNATIVTQGEEGEKRVPADGFFTGVFETTLGEGQLIKAIEFEKRSGAGNYYAFAELARRKGDYAMVGVAISTSGMQHLENSRIVLFGVSDRPERAGTAEKLIDGSPIAIPEDIREKAAASAAEGIEFAGDLHASAETKAHLSAVLVERALKDIDGGSGL